MRRRLAIVAVLASAIGLMAVSSGSAEPIKGTPFNRNTVHDELGRTVTYYVSHPSKPKTPILLMIQGSGCVPVMHVQDAGTYSTLFDLGPFAERGDFTVVAVEKPFANGPMDASAGTAKSCGPEFNNDFTAERWLVALEAALNEVKKLSWVDPRRIVVFGFSEGANMAAMLAGHNSSITDVIFVGGSGTTQLFDFVAKCYQSFDTSSCLAETQKILEGVRAKPESTSDFAWGHPFKRWASFFKVDPGEEMVRSNARIYIAFGTADTSTPAISEEVAIAKLQLAGHDVTIRRVPDAGHTLSSGPNPKFEEMDKEYRTALDWVWHHGN